jgi:tetratricopeptide (TPR) repeat protein
LSISLKERRRRSKRRSYANWKPPGNNGPRNDPFRIVFYLVAIGVCVWVYFNVDLVRAELFGDDADGREGRAASREGGGRRLQSDSTTDGGDSAGSADEVVAQAEQAYQQGQLSDAIEYYREATELAPDDASNYVQIARLLVYQSAITPGARSTELLQEAMEAADNAILVDPFDPAGFAIKGKVYDWQGRPDQASSTILQAIDIDKEYGLAHAYLAEAYVDLTRWDQAEQAIEQALALEPEHVDVRREYGYMFEMFGDYAAAATQYEAAARLHPRLVPIRIALARVYRELGKTDEALDQLFEAQTVNSSSPLVAYEIGRTYEVYLGNTESALEYYTRAANLDDTYGSPWVRMASLRYFAGRYADAIVAFERAIALDALPEALKYQVGLAYANENRCDTAIRYLEEAQALAVDNELVMDAVNSGFELCQQTPPEITPQPTEEGEDAAEAELEG